MSLLIKRGIHASSDPSLSGKTFFGRYAWTMRGVTLHLDVVFPSFPELLQPVLPLAWVDRRRRSDAGALALRSRCDCLHGVEVLRRGASFFDPPTGAPAQGSDNTFTPTVRAFREGFHFVIITQQLQREEDACVFHHAQSFEFLRKTTRKETHKRRHWFIPWIGCSLDYLAPLAVSRFALRCFQVVMWDPQAKSLALQSPMGETHSTLRWQSVTYTYREAHTAPTANYAEMMLSRLSLKKHNLRVAPELHPLSFTAR